MKGINERELLPIVRAAISGNNGEIRIFMEAIEPIIKDFIQTGRPIYEYKGWAFDLTFMNELSLVKDNPEESYSVVHENKDDYSFQVSGRTVIKVHFHSFLWNF